MKLTGPLTCIYFGLLIFAFAWMSDLGPPDPNIGRGIARGISEQVAEVIGGLICLVGVVWFLIRWLDHYKDDSS